jgi:hypothetical protein
LEDIGAVPYTGATQNVDLGEFGLTTGFVKYDTTPTNTPTDQGTTYWDADDETLAIIMNGATQKVGEDQFLQVKNQTGATIPKGSAVGYAGTVGLSGRLRVSLFLANGATASKLFLGVTAENIPDGGDGKVYTFGRLRGLNTNGFTANQVLYCSPTVAGGFTAIPPTSPNNIISVAVVVVVSATVGTLFIRPLIGSDINEDEGVRITSPFDKQLLAYTNANSLWENRSLGFIIGGTSSQFVKGDGSLDSTAYVTINTAQTITGQKTFSLDLTVNGINIGRGSGNIDSNTRVGRNALQNNTTGFSNTAIGLNALLINTEGTSNTAIGVDALLSNTSGNANTAIGRDALKNNTTGVLNTAIGRSALESNTTGFSNTAIGREALENNTTGFNNTAIGADSGRFIANGTDNTITKSSVYLGSGTRALANDQTNQIVIGHLAIGNGSNTVTLGNTSIIKTILRGTLNAANLPTSATGLIAGDIYNDSGTLKIV